MSVTLNTVRLNHTITQAAELANASPSKIYEEIRSGRLRILKLGRKTLITNEALGDWLRGLEAQSQPEPEHLRAARQGRDRPK